MDTSSLRRIERLNYFAGGALVVLAALLMQRPTALGVLVGVILSCANFSIMCRMVQGWMRVAGQNRSARSVLLMPKMALLMAAVVLALVFLPITAEGLAIGFSIFLVSIAIETVRYLASQAASAEAEEAAAASNNEDPET